MSTTRAFVLFGVPTCTGQASYTADRTVPLTDRDELLREQSAEPGRSFHRPGAPHERLSELEQAIALPSICIDAELPDEALCFVEDCGGV